jgi:hypothetical protein
MLNKELLHRLVGPMRIADDHLSAHLDDVVQAILHLRGQA